MVTLDGATLSLDQIASIAFGHADVCLSEASVQRMMQSRRVVDRILQTGEPTYGINTGFGKLADIRISSEELFQLQLNLVRSHACGLGDPLSDEIVRAMMLLRANVLSLGFSGARPEVAHGLLDFLRVGIHPEIPSKGSVGASGDLAPLAHLALGLIGEGQCKMDGVRMATSDALKRAGLTALVLEPKEGLALLNGTQAMVAVGAIALWHAGALLNLADLVGAMTTDALLGTPTAFDPRIHVIRPQFGQQECAARLHRFLEGSGIRDSHRKGDGRVQDAYSIRCMPQVHGAARCAVNHAIAVLEIESGSATDNPLVFADTGEVLSGGNFHGAPIAGVLDYAALALTDLMSISERRIDRLVNPDLSEGLPPFLAAKPGVQSGMMLAHVTAAALLCEARVLSHPASVDSVPTSGGKEDHVSMGMTAALKLQTIVTDLRQILSIELLAAAAGIDFRRPLRSSDSIERAHALVRGLVPRHDEDRVLSEDIAALTVAIETGKFRDF